MAERRDLFGDPMTVLWFLLVYSVQPPWDTRPLVTGLATFAECERLRRGIAPWLGVGDNLVCKPKAVW